MANSQTIIQFVVNFHIISRVLCVFPVVNLEGLDCNPYEISVNKPPEILAEDAFN